MEITDRQTKIKCTHCDGNGWTAEHDPHDPHEDGCCGNCPIQVQCDNCHGEGFFYLIDEVHSFLGSLVPDLKTEKDKLLIELGKLVANNEENAGYLLTDARYMYPDLTTLNRMEELIKQIGEME